jgi:integrase
LAYCYLKADEKNPRNLRWYACLSLGGRQCRVSLRLRADGNKRLAEKRTAELRYEVAKGEISAESRSWLGESSYARLMEFARPRSSGGLSSWTDACEAFLEASPGTGAAGRNRAQACRRFAAHAQASGHAPSGDPSQAARDFLSSELARGQSPVTVKGTALAYVSVMLAWLASSGHVSPVDRAALAGIVPRAPAKKLALPSHAQDLAFLRHVMAARPSVWPILALSRGLGCRPSEAAAMDWSDVDLTPGSESAKVAGKDSKITGTAARTVPILWAWVAEALRAQATNCRLRGPVCVRREGQPWRGRSGYLIAWGEEAEKASVPDIRPKQCQKLGIMQMVRAGFPAHVVAHWTGHALSVQERHYMTDGAYLPSDHDFAEFGVLSAHGVRAFALHQGGNKRGNTSPVTS